MVAELDVMISLDTSKAVVMREGCAAGGHLINDVRACKAGSAERGGRGWRTGMPHGACRAARTMQVEPHYDDLLGGESLFDERIAACLGPVSRVKHLVLDPAMALARRWRTTISCWRKSVTARLPTSALGGHVTKVYDRQPA